MQHSKQKIFETAFSFQNSKYDYFCPRCTRRLSHNKESLSPGLMNYYKNLCRSSKCLIHRRSMSCQNKINRKRDDIKKLCNHKRITRIASTNVPCHVHEFEEEDKESQYDIDPELLSKIESTMTCYDSCNGVKVDDIVGHELLKQIIKRTIIWPLKKPEIFKGLRSAPKGILLFGPPGTGKNMIGQWIAFETKSTFFNISSSSLTSKWMEETENLVRTMFVIAKARQPSVIFIDEVDSILSQRTPNENGSSRRMKNEFFIQMDESATVPDDRVMVVGATTRPEELDAAARRRFSKRLFISLPDSSDRKQLLLKHLKYECHSLEEIDVNDIVRKTEGYSAADLMNLSQEAAMGPIKSFSPKAIIRLKADKIRPISFDDFMYALQLIKPSISREELKAYEKWNSLYGYGSESEKN